MAPKKNPDKDSNNSESDEPVKPKSVPKKPKKAVDPVPAAAAPDAPKKKKPKRGFCQNPFCTTLDRLPGAGDGRKDGKGGKKDMGFGRAFHGKGANTCTQKFYEFCEYNLGMGKRRPRGEEFTLCVQKWKEYGLKQGAKSPAQIMAEKKVADEAIRAQKVKDKEAARAAKRLEKLKEKEAARAAKAAAKLAKKQAKAPSEEEAHDDSEEEHAQSTSEEDVDQEKENDTEEEEEEEEEEDYGTEDEIDSLILERLDELSHRQNLLRELARRADANQFVSASAEDVDAVTRRIHELEKALLERHGLFPHDYDNPDDDDA